MDNWGVDSVQPDELPKLCALSDLTWGMWEKVVREEVDDKTLLTNIKYFMVHSINNEITAPIIIPRALHIIGAEDGREIWPGRDVLVGGNPGSPDEQRLAEHEAARALIGSPSGLATAYFLLQHKRQLGGAKFIWKIRIFRNDDSPDPFLLFYVDANAPPEGPSARSASGDEPGAPMHDVESRIVKRSKDGRNVVREHVFRARL